MRLKIPMSLSSLFKQSQLWQKTIRKAMRTPKARPAAAAKPVKGAKAGAKPRRASVPRSARRLTEVLAFGSNPGHLRMLEYVPANMPVDAPLVVVLHGCLQQAADFDRGSGWTPLAREKGFALLFPEQRSNNNSNFCFNWFRPSAIARDRGELMSIRQMIDDMCQRHPIAPERIFVQGLSAGGAMASALLATYPERFAGGQIVAGLPFGAARDAMTALSVMKKGVNRSAAEWGDLVRLVTPEPARRPVVSIWHGTADRVVHVANAYATLSQWLDVYGLQEDDAEQVMIKGRPARVWKDARGWPLIEFHLLEGLDHGLPVVKLAANVTGNAARFILEAGVSAPRHMVRNLIQVSSPS